MYKSFIIAALAATMLSASVAHATDGERFIFRYKAALVADAGGSGGAGVPDGGGTGVPSDGSGTPGDGTGGDGSGGTDDGSETGGLGDGSSDGGDGSGSEGDGDGTGGDNGNGTGPRMTFAVRPPDDAATREHYKNNMPFSLPTVIAAPSGSYGDGDILTVCWDTEINDASGIGTAFSQRIQIPPSPMVRAVTIAGQRHARDMDSFDVLTIDRTGADGCADLELTVPEPDSYGWGMGVPFGVTVNVGVYNFWWARNAANESWDPRDEPDAYETDLSDGDGWIYIDTHRVE